MRKNNLQQNEEHIELLSNTLNLETDIMNEKLITPILKELSPYLRYLQTEIEELEKYNEIEKIQKELEELIKETNNNSSDDDLDEEIIIKPTKIVKNNKLIIDDNDINDNYCNSYRKRMI